MGQHETGFCLGGRAGRVRPTDALGTLWEHKRTHIPSAPQVNQGLQPGPRLFVEFESLRFRHIQSPDYSGLFAFLGYRKTPPGSTLGKWCRGAMRLASVPLDPSWGIRRKMMSQSFTTRVDELWCQGVVQDSRPLEGHPWETLCK